MDSIFSAISSQMVSAMVVILGGVGVLIAKSAEWLSLAINLLPGANIPVVSAIWKILRDFANMTFIVILIYMAFATIFDQSKYKFRDMFMRFIIVAILINFSLTIGEFVISVGQVLTNVSLTSIGNIGNQFGQFLNPTSLVPTTAGASAFVAVLFAVIISMIYLFSMLIALFFVIIRVPVIWGLLMVSPAAWMANILPGTQKRFTQWWDQFLGWIMFLPIYLFFLYLGLYFLSKQQEVSNAVIKYAGATNPLNASVMTGLNLTFTQLLFYIIAAFVMSYGVVAAKNITSSFGDGFDWGLGKARQWAGTVSGYDAFRKVGNQKVSEVLNGATTIMPAPFSARKQEAFFNQLLQTEAGRKGFPKEATRAFEKFEDQYDTGQLNIDGLRQKVESSKGTTAEGFAYRKLAIKKGVLNEAQFVDALASVGNNPFAVNDLVKAAKDAKFNNLGDLKGIVFNPKLMEPNFTPAKREILMHMAGDTKQASKFGKIEDIAQAVSVLGGASSPESKKFLDDLAKVRPDLVFKFRSENNLFKQPSPEDEAAGGKKSTMSTLYDTLRKSVNTEPKNLASMPDDLWKSPQFQQVLKEKLSDTNVSLKNRRNFRNNLEKILSEQGAEDKLSILNSTTPPEIRRNQNDTEEEEEETGQTENPPSGANPPTGGTVSYRGAPVNQANIIDLRNNPKIDIE